MCSQLGDVQARGRSIVNDCRLVISDRRVIEVQRPGQHRRAAVWDQRERSIVLRKRLVEHVAADRRIHEARRSRYGNTRAARHRGVRPVRGAGGGISGNLISGHCDAVRAE